VIGEIVSKVGKCWPAPLRRENTRQNEIKAMLHASF
jgi:hypothetical protein